MSPVLRKLFGKDDKIERELTIEDLVTLERYEEAATRLKARVKSSPKDLHAHLKLAEVYVELRQLEKALDEYALVADSYAADGFYDKGMAILGKAAKLVPGDDNWPRRIELFRRQKRLEHRRRLAIEGLKANTTTGKTAGNSAVEFELLWNQIAKSHLVEALDGEQLKNLFSAMEMRPLVDDEVLGEEGKDSPLMYLIVNGVVSASAATQSGMVNIRNFTTGDIIGEAALLEQKPWPATYRVQTAGIAFALDRPGFEQVMIGNEDPRGFIATLRRQDNDRDVANLVVRMRNS